MSRHAVIIAASPTEDPIPGVHTDLETWNLFLRSNLGGLWSNGEITLLRDCTLDQLRPAIASAATANYAMIVFAGHGRTVRTDKPWPETQLILADGNAVLESELNPGTASCTLILDCCRRSAEMEEKLELVKVASLLEDHRDPVRSRALYTSAITAAEKGLAKVYATEVGSAAADSASFSQHLIYGAKLWSNKNQGVLPLPAAVALSTELLAKTNPQQTPQYNGGRRLHHFPFAVSA